MNKKTLLTAFLATFLCGGLSSFSQSVYYSSSDNQKQNVNVSDDLQYQPENKYNAYKTTWKKNRFKDTWYITLGSGGQIIMAEDDDKGSFGSRITYAPSITIGKYFSPIWGLRVQLTGGSLHGYNDGVGGTYRKWNKGSKHYEGNGYVGVIDGYPKVGNAQMHTWDPQWASMGFKYYQDEHGNDIGEIRLDPDGYSWTEGRNGGLYMQHIRYAAVNLNFMFDFLTLVGNYNPKRPFEITPFGGISYAHLFPHKGSDAYDALGVNAGLNFRFRLSNKFDFNLEGALTAYPDDFDGHIGGSRSMDLVTQGIVGITYKIGKSTWEPAEPMNYEMVRDLNNKINDLQSQLAVANKPCPTCPPCPPAPTTVAERPKEAIKFLPDPVFFRIDKSVIDGSEWSKIEKAVDYLNSYPDANVVVTGYADRKTGYPDYNMRLSERRAKAVSKALIDRYGINPLRITINWEGDRVQPFEINAWNRVVVFVIE
ncbi:MAG: OmpA family protein [Dysgonomonas sp.]